MTTHQAPRLVATVGLHGSASTWVFNIVRELMIASLGDENVVAIYAEDAPALFAEHALEGRHVVLKSHHGGAGWDSLLWLTRAPIILSIRDPRDAALSMVERFGGQLGDAVRWIGTDCRRLVRCADAGHMLLRYEDRFFADSTQPGRLAAHLGLAVDGSTCRALAERYSTTEVGAFAATLSELPADRVIRNERLMFDRVTQIHRTHIGDGRIGKWRDRLAPQVRAEITRYFEPFLTRFGYEQA